MRNTLVPGLVLIGVYKWLEVVYYNEFFGPLYGLVGGMVEDGVETLSHDFDLLSKRLGMAADQRYLDAVEWSKKVAVITASVLAGMAVLRILAGRRQERLARQRQ